MDTERTVASTPLELPRRLLVIVFVAVGLWYLTWRVGTLNLRAPIFSALIYGAELFGFGTALLHIFMCWRLSDRRSPPPAADLSVDVFVPTYNESVELVRETLIAACAMDHPHRTWLLDDGRRPEMRALAGELGCRYLAREGREHAKAGNLNHAFAHSDGEVIVVFDADHAPRRDFLTKTLGYFEDPEVAFVQTPQDYYNLDSYQHRRRGASSEVWTEQALFFRVIQRGKDCWNAAFFCGSCAAVRRSALGRIGGFATGTVTEDLHTSLRLHAAGFRSVYHAEPLAFGLAPESIEPFITQRVRWGQGAMHVWRTEGIVSNPGLTWAQRLNYLASVLTYFDGWQKAVFYLAPIVVLLSGRMPLVTTTPQFLLHFLPYYLLTFWAFEEVGRGYGNALYIEQYNMARFAAFAWATLAWLFPTLKFKVTRKRRQGRRVLRFSAAQLAVLGGNFLAIPAGIGLYLHGHALPFAGLVANIVWAAVNCGLAAAVVRHVLIVGRSRRAHYRFPVPLPAELDFGGFVTCGTLDDLSVHGMRFYGPMPPDIAPDRPFEAQLTLPDGPLSVTGRVRGLIPVGDDSGHYKGCRATLTATVPQQRRIEQFLFGSNMQWLVNGYRDQAQTPLGWMLPSIVTRTRRSPFVDVRWNAGRITTGDGRSVQALLSTSADRSSLWAIAFVPLPQDQPVRLVLFRNTPSRPRVVTLRHAPDQEQAGLDIHVYRVTAEGSDLGLWAEDAPAQQREVA